MTLSDAVKRSFVTGIVLVTPLVITLFVFRTLVVWSLQVVDPVVEGTGLAQYTGENVAVAQLAAAVLMVLAVTVLGYVAQHNVGRQVFGNAGRVVDVVPLVSTVYSSVRQVANSFVDRDAAYESVVLVEYPREGVYAIGLVTGDAPAAVEGVVGERAHTVFLPNSPNPTGGRLVMLPDDEVQEVDVSVRRGLGLLVTTGIGADDEAALPPLDDTGASDGASTRDDDVDVLGGASTRDDTRVSGDAGTRDDDGASDDAGAPD